MAISPKESKSEREKAENAATQHSTTMQQPMFVACNKLDVAVNYSYVKMSKRKHTQNIKSQNGLH